VSIGHEATRQNQGPGFWQPRAHMHQVRRHPLAKAALVPRMLGRVHAALGKQ
jgi:hypothetical protein